MAAKLGGYLSKFFAVVFTSILAPVLVDLVVRDIHGAGHKPDDAPPAVAQHAPSPGIEVIHVIVQGMGRTPAEALQNAFRTALFQAIADRTDASARANVNPDLVDAILRDGSGLIVSWKELGAKKEWRLKGSLYHREVAVTVDGHRLAERLRAVPAAVRR